MKNMWEDAHRKQKGNGMRRTRRGCLCILLCGILLTGCSAGEQLRESPAPKGITLTAFIQYADTTPATWKGWGAAKLYEDTGLTLEFYSTDAQVEQRLKQYMVSGAIPDIIGFQSREQAKLYMDAGILLPLNEYEDLLPAVFQKENYAKAIDYSRRYVNDKNEDLLLLPVSVGETAPDSYRSVPMLQQSAWQKAGEPRLNTLEDYLDAVERMLKEKPLSNTGEVMYGISLYQTDDEVAEHVAALAYLYGIDIYTVSTLMETNLETGNISSILEEDSFYKRALRFFYEANRRGLLDGDSASQTYSNLERKISSGRVMLTWSAEMAEKYNVIQRGYGDRAGKTDGYTAHLAEDMRLYREKDHVVGSNQYLAVNRYSNHIEEACQLLNWLYEEETQFYLYNGPEGVLWEYGEDGRPYVTQSGQQLQNTGEELPGYTGTLQDGIGPFGELPRTPASRTEEGYSLSSSYWEEKEDPFLAVLEARGRTVDATSAIYMLDTVPAELNQRMENLQECVGEYSWNMIYAPDEESFEAFWQELKERAADMGMDSVESFYRSAWERACALAEEYE